ncbi:MAG: CcmD family protein [Terriglobales bacterium]
MLSVVAAFSVAWIAITIYVLTLGGRQRELERAVAAMRDDDRGE